MQLINSFPGWTWEYVEDHITVPRLNKIIEYWTTKQPSLAASMAAMIGFKPKGSNTEVQSGIEELLSQVPRRVVPIQAPPQALPEPAQQTLSRDQFPEHIKAALAKRSL